MYGGDVLYAYIYASAGCIHTSLAVDRAYEEWWNKTENLCDKPKFTRKYVLRKQHYLQGSPKSGNSG